jgi:IS30 family transposase
MRQKHFSIEERESLFKFLIQGLSVSEISKKLEKHRSSIYRELKRNNMSRKNYSPSKANENYKVRKKQCGRNSKIIKNSFLAIFIEALIKKKYTPEQICGQYKKGVKVCFKTVYRAIEMNIIPTSLKNYLPRKGKKKPKGYQETRGKINGKRAIEERCEEANNREAVGHFESDTIIGSGKKGAIMTYVDRKSRFLIAELMEDRRADTFNEHTLENFKYIPSGYIKSFTSDNGKEFAGFKELEKKLGVITYFANPYHSWERGTNENRNGILRRYFPKGTDFKELTKEKVNKAVYEINHKPLKILGWKTPYEVFWGEIYSCCI